MDTKRSLRFALFSTLIACSASNARDPHFDPATLSPDDPRAHCEVGRWCWLDGEPFVAMHGLSAESVVAASARGEMWRFSGSGWEPLGFPFRSLTQASLRRAREMSGWQVRAGSFTTMVRRGLSATRPRAVCHRADGLSFSMGLGRATFGPSAART